MVKVQHLLVAVILNANIIDEDVDDLLEEFPRLWISFFGHVRNDVWNEKSIDFPLLEAGLEQQKFNSLWGLAMIYVLFYKYISGKVRANDDVVHQMRED